jgi:hypothetical protein
VNCTELHYITRCHCPDRFWGPPRLLSNWYQGLSHEEVIGSEMWLRAFLTQALDGGEWSASCPGRFTPRERAHHWIGGWTDSRNGLDLLKNSHSVQKSNLGRPVRSYVTTLTELSRLQCLNYPRKQINFGLINLFFSLEPPSTMKDLEECRYCKFFPELLVKLFLFCLKVNEDIFVSDR